MPDIEWDVDTDSTRQVLAKTSSRSSSRRTKFAILIVIALGITLGVAYQSIPEPPTPAAPTPTPVSRPSLEQTIDQEAYALERGTLQTFMLLQDPNDQDWRTQQLNSFKDWGVPPANGRLYSIVESGTLSSGQVWVDINQARDGQYFRETRFYRLAASQWVRTAPDVSLWGDGRVLRTNHFDLHYQEGDDYHVQIVAQQLEKIYTRICQDLNCALGKPIEPLVLHVCGNLECNDTARIDPSLVPQFTVILSPIAPEPNVFDYTQQHVTVTMPSPRIGGLYFQSLYNSVPGNDEPIKRLAIDTLRLPDAIAYLATGAPERWSKSQQGIDLVSNIQRWEENRLIPVPGYETSLFPLRKIPANKLPTLEDTWNDEFYFDVKTAYAAAASVIWFIEAKYGADGVAHFLNAIGPARSISDALQNGLNISYEDFDREWRAWLKSLLAK